MSLLFNLFDEDDPPPKERKKSPETFPDLALARYVHKGAGHCSACNARIEWFKTPWLRNMPFSYKNEIVVGEDTIRAVTSGVRLEPHHAACPYVERFRRRSQR